MLIRVASLLIVILTSVVITSFSIDATSKFTQSTSWWTTMTGTQQVVCPQAMVLVPSSGVCIDMYEVSPVGRCPHRNPTSPRESQDNIESGCVVSPVAEAMPWRFVTHAQAAQLCALRGMRLPSNKEWYQAALGTRTEGCAVSGYAEAVPSGSMAACLSGVGAFDLVGNVWEFTNEEVVDGWLGAYELPREGYIEQVSVDGIPLVTADVPNTVLQSDYLWRAPAGRAVVLRGGFYGSGEDAGLYSMQAAESAAVAGAGIGFRCVDDVESR